MYPVDDLLKKINKLEKENRLLKLLISIKNQNIINYLNNLKKSNEKSNLALPLKPKTKQIKKLKQRTFQRLSRSYIKQGIMLTPMDLWKMAKRQKGLCPLTGLRLKGNVISLDHIIPKSKGGSNDISNLRLTLFVANQAKHSCSDEEFFNLCKAVINKQQHENGY